jgi:hypothetical protein
MNKHGQNFLLALITAVMLFMAGMLFLNHVKDDVSLTRTIGLDCSSTTISDGTKVTCLGVDLVMPILIIAIVSVSMGVILERFMI